MTVTIGLVLQFLVVLFGKIVPMLWDLFKKNPADFVLKSSEAFGLAKQAVTPEEKINAAKKIQDLISSLH